MGKRNRLRQRGGRRRRELANGGAAGIFFFGLLLIYIDMGQVIGLGDYKTETGKAEQDDGLA